MNKKGNGMEITKIQKPLFDKEFPLGSVALPKALVFGSSLQIASFYYQDFDLCSAKNFSLLINNSNLTPN